MEDNRIYVDLTLIRDKDGVITPLSIHWEDGRKFKIQRILNVRPIESLKDGAGRKGFRYTIVVGNQRRYLYLEDDRFYIVI